MLLWRPSPLRRPLLLALLFSLVSPHRSTAQVATPEGVALSPFPVLESPPSYATFSDGWGGIWAFYLGAHPGTAVHANHVHLDGAYQPGFGAQSRSLTATGTQANGVSAAWDGLGGAVVSWFGVNPADSTSPFVALRYLGIPGDGLIYPQFNDTGIVVSSIASDAMIVGDDAGGAYVVWEELKGTANPDLFAQHFDAWGTPQWTPIGSPTGRPVCAVVGIQRLRAIHRDGSGGAYVIWSDQRGGTTTPLYVAHLSHAGVDEGAWTTNGVRVSPVTTGIRLVGSATSPDGGLWLAWRDLAVANQVLGQHVAVNGSFRWSSLGATIATVSPSNLDFVPATGGHLLATWGGTDVRCSRLDSTGVRVWFGENSGRVIVTPPGGALTTRAGPDGAGGQWIAWSQDVSGQMDVRTLRADGAAAIVPGQAPGGEVFAAGPLDEEPVRWFDSAGGEPLLAWLDGGVLRIRQIPTTSLGVDPAPLAADLALAVPAPHPLRGPRATLRFAAPAGTGRLELFDLAGRRVAGRDLASRGGAQVVELREAAGLPAGVYTLRLTLGDRSVSRRVVRLE